METNNIAMDTEEGFKDTNKDNFRTLVTDIIPTDELGWLLWKAHGYTHTRFRCHFLLK